MNQLQTSETLPALPSALDNRSANGKFSQGNAMQVRHGMRNSKTYKIWCGVLSRCRTPSASGYANYGGRGISVCERWMSFENFFADMGECPDGGSIDRIDTNGNYEPGNCRWADRKTQNRNQRDIPRYEFDGQKKCIAEWADSTGIPSACLRNRIVNYGWDVSRALTTPVRGHKSYERNR